MRKSFSYQTKGVCSSKIIIEFEDDVIFHVEIVDGCPGNTEAVSKLCVGRTFEEVIGLLSGIDCRGRGTSCPDQLAKACLVCQNKESDCVEAIH